MTPHQHLGRELVAWRAGRNQQGASSSQESEREEEANVCHGSALPPFDVHRAQAPEVLALACFLALAHLAKVASRANEAHDDGHVGDEGDEGDRSGGDGGGGHSGALFGWSGLESQNIPCDIGPQFLAGHDQLGRVFGVPDPRASLDLRAAFSRHALLAAMPFAHGGLGHLQGRRHGDLTPEGLDGSIDCFVHATSIGITCSARKCIACYRLCLLESLMLSGPELAAAFAEAMRLKKAKGITQQQVADAFGVRQASVSEWGKTGRIAKKHLNLLVEYFADVVGAEHWGLHEAIQDALARSAYPEATLRLSPLEIDLIAAFRQLPDDEQNELLHDVMARAESINQVVQRELKRLGHNVSGYISATKAAEHLPPAPRGLVREDRNAPTLRTPARRVK